MREGHDKFFSGKRKRGPHKQEHPPEYPARVERTYTEEPWDEDIASPWRVDGS